MTHPAERATVVLAVLVGAVALHLASEFLVPVTLALLLVALLWPVVQKLAQWHIPAAAGATVCILGIVALLVGAGAALGPPIRNFADEIPKSIEAARPKIAAMSASVGRLTGTQSTPKTTGAVTRDSASAINDTTAAKNDSTAAKNDSTVAKHDSTATKHDSTAANSDSTASSKAGTGASLPTPAPSSITHALGVASSLIGDFVEVMLLAMFVLAAGTAWKQKLDKAVNSPTQRRNIAEIVAEMRSVVSRYVLLTALINLAQATVVGFALKLLGYPSPLLWGILTFTLEFVPYLGGMTIVALLSIAGLAAGRGFPSMLTGPAAYLAVTTLQNNVLSPIVYGSRMKLNPVAILLGLMLWYMIWGVAGAFLSVPLLAAFNVFASRTPSLKSLSVFLSE